MYKITSLVLLNYGTAVIVLLNLVEVPVVTVLELNLVLMSVSTV